MRKKQNKKICKDGRIWGQNNKEARNHLGILTGKKKYIKKGYNENSRFPVEHPFFGGRLKMSEKKRGIKNSFYGKRHLETTKRKMREARIKYLSSGKMKDTDTKIEQKIEKELKRRNIYYQKQVPLCKVTIVDFYLPQTRIVIYCDGDYWHSKEKVKNRDANQDFILTFNRFNVYRFTETQINKSAKKCINKIFEKR